MNEPNIIVYENSQKALDYKDLLCFYNHEVYLTEETLWLNLHTEKDNTIYVIDTAAMDEAISVANKIREIDVYAPLIIVVEAGYRGDLHKDVQQINGLGRLIFARYYSDGNFQLMPYIDAVIHPQNRQQRSEIAVAIPVYNEESRIQYVTSLILKLQKLVTLGHHSISIYIIDDGSNDGTVDQIHMAIDDYYKGDDTVYWAQPLNLRCLGVNTRKAGTYLEAFSCIDAAYILTVDGDDSFSMEDIVHLIDIARCDYYDMVIATKDQSTQTRTLVRRLLSFGKQKLTAPFLPKGVTDSQTGLKVFRRSAVLLMLPYLNMTYGLAMDLEIMFLAKKMRLRVKEISVTIIDREGSHINIVSDTLRFLKSMTGMALHQDYRKMV